MAGFHGKLKNTKAKLRNWNAQVFGNIFRQVREAERALQQKEHAFDLLRDTASRATLGEARAHHARALALEREFWQQKSAIRWIR